jgi:uncharacterized protein (DUF885 family)
MKDQQPKYEIPARLDALADEICTDLAARFPVCLASDEFHFFPHFKAARQDWPRWDDFSDDCVQTCLDNISRWHVRIEQIKSSGHSFSEATDLDLLARALTTLDEQLRHVRPHKTQPTFYLTIISIGLAEALEDSRDAFEQRTGALAGFLDSARVNLVRIPLLYKDLGLEMLPRLGAWVAGLVMSDSLRRRIGAAFDRYSDHLRRAAVDPDFRMGNELYERIVDRHMGCRMGLSELAWHLDREVEAAVDQLTVSAERIDPGKPWQSVFKTLPAPAPAGNDVTALYRAGIDQLRDHGLEAGFLTPETMAGCDVEIQIIPDHLRPVRADAAYSMPPGHPPRGGVFFILPQNRQTVPRDMMLLAAHETYPGHHLLDTRRWGHPRPLRRCLEFPLFYEGWASFGEEILFDTGFFSGPADRLLSAKRRFWRAHRGRADLNIHSGRWRLEEAALALDATGLVNRDAALAMVRRYALKPGYQLSYAIGRRKFRELYAAYLSSGRKPAQFVRDAVSHGEIGFEHLAKRLLR